MTEHTEKELNEFFVMVANYRLSHNNNILNYLEYLNKIPEVSSHYYYTSLISEILECKYGRTDLAKAMSYKHYAPFTNEDLKAFDKQRAGLVKVLKQIVKDQSLEKIRGLGEIANFANSLQPKRNFEIGKKDQKYLLISCESFPAGIELDDTVLNEVFKLACYSLCAFLADDKGGGLGRIKKCDECKKFFPSKRRREDNRFCSDRCRLAWNNKLDIKSGKRAADKRKRYNWEALSDEKYLKRYGQKRSVCKG